jgi:hypothetical protein
MEGPYSSSESCIKSSPSSDILAKAPPGILVDELQAVYGVGMPLVEAPNE